MIGKKVENTQLTTCDISLAASSVERIVFLRSTSRYRVVFGFPEFFVKRFTKTGLFLLSKLASPYSYLFKDSYARREKNLRVTFYENFSYAN